MKHIRCKLDIKVWTEAVFGKKKLRIQKYPDTCGQGLSEYMVTCILVITKGYRVQATTIEGQNAFPPLLCFAQVSRDKWSKARVIRFRVIGGPNARDQIVFYAFHTFLSGKASGFFGSSF